MLYAAGVASQPAQQAASYAANAAESANTAVRTAAEATAVAQGTQQHISNLKAAIYNGAMSRSRELERIVVEAPVLLAGVNRSNSSGSGKRIARPLLTRRSWPSASK